MGELPSPEELTEVAALLQRGEAVADVLACAACGGPFACQAASGALRAAVLVCEQCGRLELFSEGRIFRNPETRRFELLRPTAAELRALGRAHGELIWSLQRHARQRVLRWRCDDPPLRRRSPGQKMLPLETAAADSPHVGTLLLDPTDPGAPDDYQQAYQQLLKKTAEAMGMPASVLCDGPSNYSSCRPAPPPPEYDPAAVRFRRPSRWRRCWNAAAWAMLACYLGLIVGGLGQLLVSLVRWIAR